MVVAVAVGQSGVNTLLVASQVVLSIVLPFVTLPLIYLTSSKRIMSVRKPLMLGPAGSSERQRKETTEGTQVPDGEKVDFSNGKIVMGLGAIIWLVVLVANAYVIVMLAIS
jgi:metal iron transporter